MKLERDTALTMLHMLLLYTILLYCGVVGSDQPWLASIHSVVYTVPIRECHNTIIDTGSYCGCNFVRYKRCMVPIMCVAAHLVHVYVLLLPQ